MKFEERFKVILENDPIISIWWNLNVRIKWPYSQNSCTYREVWRVSYKWPKDVNIDEVLVVQKPTNWWKWFSKFT